MGEGWERGREKQGGLYLSMQFIKLFNLFDQRPLSHGILNHCDKRLAERQYVFEQ